MSADKTAIFITVCAFCSQSHAVAAGCSVLLFLQLILVQNFDATCVKTKQQEVVI